MSALNVAVAFACLLAIIDRPGNQDNVWLIVLGIVNVFFAIRSIRC